MHIKVPLESLYLLKNPHQNPLGDFKDLSIKGQTAGNNFVLYYVYDYEVTRRYRTAARHSDMFLSDLKIQVVLNYVVCFVCGR
jgi:hypothetical protein